MKRVIVFLAAILFVGMLFVCCGERELADQIFTAGHVVTMNESYPVAEAFAVAEGRIIRVGSSEELRSFYPGAPEVDLGGKTVMPGIVESHVHLFSLGRSFLELNVEGVASPAEVAELVRERAATAAPGEWITGWGWDEGAWAVEWILAQDRPPR